jgi:HK97 gp10 family phage protein
LVKAAEPVAVAARALSPDDPNTPAPDLKSSIMVATQLTKRHRKGEKENEVEVYVGPTRVPGRSVLNYASFAEYGTSDTPAHPYLRPAWEREKGAVMEILARELKVEIDKTAARLSRKAAKLGQ